LLHAEDIAKRAHGFGETLHNRAWQAIAEVVGEDTKSRIRLLDIPGPTESMEEAAGGQAPDR
jgi:hypothetical protein